MMAHLTAPVGLHSTVVAIETSIEYDLVMPPLLDAICDAIEASDKTRYRIAKDTGISQGHLSRLMSGERGVSVAALEQLAEYLDMEIVIRPKRRSRKGR